MFSFFILVPISLADWQIKDLAGGYLTVSQIIERRKIENNNYKIKLY